MTLESAVAHKSLLVRVVGLEVGGDYNGAGTTTALAHNGAGTTLTALALCQRRCCASAVVVSDHKVRSVLEDSTRTSDGLWLGCSLCTVCGGASAHR